MTAIQHAPTSNKKYKRLMLAALGMICLVALLLFINPNHLAFQLGALTAGFGAFVTLLLTLDSWGNAYVDQQQKNDTMQMDKQTPDWRQQMKRAQDAGLQAVLDWQNDTHGAHTNGFQFTTHRNFIDSQRGIRVDKIYFARHTPNDIFDTDAVPEYAHTMEGSVGSHLENNGTGILQDIATSSPAQIIDLKARIERAMAAEISPQLYGTIVFDRVASGMAETAPYKRANHPRMIPVILS